MVIAGRRGDPLVVEVILPTPLLHLLHLLLNQQVMLQAVIVVRMKTVEVVVVELMVQRRRRRMVRMVWVVVVVAVRIRVAVVVRRSSRPAHILRHAGI